MISKQPQYSWLMRLLMRCRLNGLAWACRRLHCPVKNTDLVLEVGSGGSPYFRSNVLVDAYKVTRERHWAPLVNDRPTVIGTGEALPFKDKAFDFVIASHVLEHSHDPEKFLNELQRVSRAGYIETPDAFMERINPYWDHRSEVTVDEGVLVIRKKSGWCVDRELVSLYERKVKPWLTTKGMPKQPFLFHVRYYWRDSINFAVTNPHVDSTWQAPVFQTTTHLHRSFRARMGRLGLFLARAIFSQRGRNKHLNIQSLLRCPACLGEDVSLKDTSACCRDCGHTIELV